ncbi:MAG: hypothetical protein ABR602_06520 [Gemmatimonadales bacterium]
MTEQMNHSIAAIKNGDSVIANRHIGSVHETGRPESISMLDQEIRHTSGELG